MTVLVALVSGNGLQRQRHKVELWKAIERLAEKGEKGWMKENGTPI